ncbi:MAG: class I SAM-dependent methyltransferase [Rhodospirillaceae bacterium]|nr:class I SAM-dependent methyltransferase [Rhodospirillaceae bacterium]MCA8933227.1 class I SAM-dependent methyltransferase [Rhodospirillaceae bacterium]
MTDTMPPRRLIKKTYTERNRYGWLFPALRSLECAFDMRFRRILSYGCSSGLECLTLRDLFPDAIVVGTDANPEMIEEARKTCDEDTNILITPYDEFWSITDHFDMICCMSVLFEIQTQYIPKPEWVSRMASSEHRLSTLQGFGAWLETKFPFSEFESIVSGLDKRLNGGGLMVLMNANYRLLETSFGQNYQAILFPGTNIETMPKFHRDYGVIDQAEYTEIVFRKHS